MTEIQNSKDSQFGLFIKLAENEADLFVLFIATKNYFLWLTIIYFAKGKSIQYIAIFHYIYSYALLRQILCVRDWPQFWTWALFGLCVMCVSFSVTAGAH